MKLLKNSSMVGFVRVYIVLSKRLITDLFGRYLGLMTTVGLNVRRNGDELTVVPRPKWVSKNT